MQAGFTTGTPWIAVNPNYTEINVKAEIADARSVFHYYKKLITLRKEYPVVVYGKYEALMEESDELFVYTRTLENEKLLVVCSFCDHEAQFTMLTDFAGATCLISNVENVYDKAGMILKPFEAFVLYRKIF